MKKFLLLGLLSVVFAASGISQNLSLLLDQGFGDISNDQEINFYLEPESGFVAIEGELTNNSSASLKVLLKKVYVDVLSGTNNYFCFAGSCFPENVFLCPFPQNMEAGQTVGGLTLDYSPNDQVGVSIIRYVLFDEGNPNDSLSFTVNFITDNSGVGINDIDSFVSSFSQIYPNPATTSASIDFAFTSKVSEAKIVVSSILGSKVSEIILSEQQGTAIVNTEHLNEGIYFCSLVINGEMTQTRKLIVRK